PVEPTPTGRGKQRRRLAAPSVEDTGDFQRRASQEGKAAQKLAFDVLEDAGFNIVATNRKIPRTGVTVNYVALDAAGEPWYFDVSGAFTSHRGGLLRTDTVWKSLGRASVLRGAGLDGPLVLI